MTVTPHMVPSAAATRSWHVPRDLGQHLAVGDGRARARRGALPPSISTSRWRRGRVTRAPSTASAARTTICVTAASVTLTPGASVFTRPPAPAASRRPRRGTTSSSRRSGTRRCRGSRAPTSRVVGTPSTSSSRSARRARAIAAVARRRRARSPSRSASRSTAGSTVPSSTNVSTRTPGPSGGRKRVERARRGREAARRVLGVDPDLDRVTASAARGRVSAQRLAGGDRDLLADEVEPGARARSPDARPGGARSAR